MTVGESPRWVTPWRRDGPQPVRRRVVGRAFVHDERRAAQQGSGDRPGTHHPAQVGDPEEPIPGPQVEDVGEVLRGLDRETAVDVDGALRPAGGARGVDEHEGRLGVGLGRLAQRLHRGIRQRFVPPDVPPRLPGQLPESLAEPPHDQYLAHRGCRGHGRVGGLLQPHDPPATAETVCRDEQGRLAVGQARGHGGRAVPGEDRREDRLELAQRQHRDGRLGQHRQQDPDAVAGTNAMRLKHPGGEVHGPPQLLVGVAPDVAVLTLPGDGESLRITGRTTIDGRRSVVEGAAAPPARPLHAAGEVQRGRRPALPVERQVVRGRRPEPGRIHDGAGLEGLQVGLADGAQESGQERCGRGRGIRSPGDAGHVAPEGRPGIRGAGAGHPPILAPGG